jgi:hypothetical protein
MYIDFTFVCENSFEGGGWLQVRYINSSPEKWHRARDGLRGTDVYGYPGLSEYSIYYKDLLAPNSVLLFSTGMHVRRYVQAVSLRFSFLLEQARVSLLGRTPILG